MILTQDIPKLYTALAEWLSCVVIIAAQRRRAPRGNRYGTAAVLAGGLVLLCIIQTLCGMTDDILWLLGMAVAVAVMYGMFCGTLSGDTPHIAYLTARAFMRAEWIAAMEWQLDRFYVPDGYEQSVLFSVVFCLIIYVLMAAVFFGTELYFMRREMSFDRMEIIGGSAAGIWVLTLLFFIFSNLSYVEVPTPFKGSGLMEIFNIRALVDLAGVIMVELLNMEKLGASRRREEDAIRSMLHLQYQQYRQSQENMDLINRKYHDLKHQLQVLRAENDSGRRLAYLDEMEDELRFYETENHTGNAVLDTILTEKSRICLKQKIQMKAVADGKLLNNMHVMDLATIFGNALDNAIEHEVQIEDPEKRMIRVSVSRKAMMILIVIENYFEGELRQSRGVYLTTKADERFHGYGLKSIRYAVEKYHGVFSAGVEDGWFRVKIMLPM